jgi:Aldo/keto reductase family
VTDDPKREEDADALQALRPHRPSSLRVLPRRDDLRRGLGLGAPKEECARILDPFAEAGGNFIDTANAYTDGTSERIVGELVATVSVRTNLAP